MANLKDRLEAGLEERKANSSILNIAPVTRSEDPELEAALELVAQGKLDRAYRTRFGALVTTAVSDPENSPAAPPPRL